MVNGKKKYLPFKYYTDESIHPEFWNPEKGRAREKKKEFPNYPEFNNRMQNIEDTVLDTVRKLQNDGVKLTKDTLKAAFDRIWKQSKDMTPGVEFVPESAPGTNNGEQSMELLTFVDHFIKTSTNTKGTITTYKGAANVLKEYQASKGVTLTLMDIDMDFYNDFIFFLKDKQYAPNTIGNNIKILKRFLGEANERGLTVKADYLKKGFKKLSEDAYSIYLNEAELKRMLNLDLALNEKLEKVRNLFLIGCYTGLRFSDLSKLSNENITDNTLSIKTIKTGTDVVIPIHPIVRNILEKYEYKLPKLPYNEIFNARIKGIAEMAGIDESVYIEQTKGDRRIKKSLPKHQMVSSHTARRSFATNAYLRDVPSISIMKITGHKTEKSFLKYIKISQKDNANKLMNHAFFNQPVTV